MSEEMPELTTVIGGQCEATIADDRDCRAHSSWGLLVKSPDHPAGDGRVRQHVYCSKEHAAADARLLWEIGCDFPGPTWFTWSITERAHQACAQCQACAEQAAITARATGSVAGSCTDGEHRAAVARTYGAIQL